MLRLNPVNHGENVSLVDGQRQEESYTRATSVTPAPQATFIQNLDDWTQQLTQGGAVLGLAALFCPLVRPLRPLGAAAIGILSTPAVAAPLLASGTYLTARHLPDAFNAAGRILRVDYRNKSHNLIEDALFLSGYGIGLVGLGVGWGSFGLGARTFIKSRRFFLQSGYLPQRATHGAWVHGDAVRRAFQDPEIWVQWGRSLPGLSPLERYLTIQAGKLTNRLLIGGSALVGMGRLGIGALQLLSERDESGPEKQAAVLGLLMAFALDVGPGVTTLLYRAGRGDRGFNLGPALSQELTEAHYQNPRLREIVYARIRQSVPSLRPEEEYAFLEACNRDLKSVKDMLEAAKALPAVDDAIRIDVSQLNLPAPKIPGPQNFRSIPVEFLPGARGTLPTEMVEQLSQSDLTFWKSTYQSGRVSPLAVLRSIQKHPAADNSSLFPRSVKEGSLARQLEKLALESEARLAAGRARPLEGIFVAVKDLFPGLDGVMNLGSKTARIKTVENNPVLKTLTRMGAIPFPVGMVAAANGGSGMNAGYGYIPHPTRRSYDPAGSSSATAYILGLKDFPTVVGIGTDTGGSVTAPAGAVGLTSLVPSEILLSTKNMVPFDTLLDRVGFLARHRRDAQTLLSTLAPTSHRNGHPVDLDTIFRSPRSLDQPTVVYLKDVVNQASRRSRKHFQKEMENYRQKGFQVRELGREWNFLVEAPLLLYPIDAYGAAAFTHTNPLNKNFFEPPRRSLDRNLWTRLPKGEISLRYGRFDEARALTGVYRKIVLEKLGSKAILASPSTEAIRTRPLLDGKAGGKLDQHDRITMAKNRNPEWGQLNLPKEPTSPVGVALSGPMAGLIHFL